MNTIITLWLEELITDDEFAFFIVNPRSSFLRMLSEYYCGR